MFRGIFTSPLDEKNRAVVPGRLRDAISAEKLQDGFVITMGFEGSLMMFLRDDWRELEKKYASLPFTNPDARLFRRAFIAPALPVATDKVGRITLAESHLKFAGIESEVSFNGNLDFIEIWSPERWRAYQAENSGKLAAVAASLFGSEAGMGGTAGAAAGSGSRPGN